MRPPQLWVFRSLRRAASTAPSTARRRTTRSRRPRRAQISPSAIRGRTAPAATRRPCSHPPPSTSATVHALYTESNSGVFSSYFVREGFLFVDCSKERTHVSRPTGRRGLPLGPLRSDERGLPALLRPGVYAVATRTEAQCCSPHLHVPSQRACGGSHP